MTKFNNYVPQAPKKCEVRYLENENKQAGLSPAAKAKVINKSGSNYVSERSTIINPSYGPCKNSLCGCSCSSNTCNCANVSFRDEPTSASISASGKAKTEPNYLWAKGQVNTSFSTKDSKSETRFISSTFGGEIEANPLIITNLQLKLGVNLVEHKSNGVEARLGINVDTGASVNSNGVEAKFLGLGFSVGKKNGISTPLGGFSVDKDECVVQ